MQGKAGSFQSGTDGIVIHQDDGGAEISLRASAFVDCRLRPAGCVLPADHWRVVSDRRRVRLAPGMMLLLPCEVA